MEDEVRPETAEQATDAAEKILRNARPRRKP